MRDIALKLVLSILCLGSCSSLSNSVRLAAPSRFFETFQTANVLGNKNNFCLIFQRVKYSYRFWEERDKIGTSVELSVSWIAPSCIVITHDTQPTESKHQYAHTVVRTLTVSVDESSRISDNEASARKSECIRCIVKRRQSQHHSLCHNRNLGERFFAWQRMSRRISKRAKIAFPALAQNITFDTFSTCSSKCPMSS